MTATAWWEWVLLALVGVPLVALVFFAGLWVISAVVVALGVVWDVVRGRDWRRHPD